MSPFLQVAQLLMINFTVHYREKQYEYHRLINRIWFLLDIPVLLESARVDVIPHVHVNAEQANQMTENSFNNPKFTLGTGTGAINLHN